ncbi:MAG TPA: hypothetical protein VG406_08095 [Isosphaeraceae bacterium]|nr:hypothetical protein [Isosphaeraceae bacterium]
MRPRHRYVPSLDALPVRLAPCTMLCSTTTVDLSTTSTSTTVCSDSVTTTVDPTMISGPAPISG